MEELKKLKEFRKEKGLTVKEAAKELCIHQRDLEQIEQGVRKVSEAKARKLFAFYGYDYQVNRNIVKIIEK